MSRFLFALLLLAATAQAQTPCLKQFYVAGGQSDGFVNSTPSCDYGNVELDMVRWNNATTDLTLLDYDTSPLAGQIVTAASLNPTITWSSISDAPLVIGEYMNWTPFPCAANYANVITNTAISGAPVTSIPKTGIANFPLANLLHINTLGHTRFRLGFSGGAGYSEIDFRSFEGNALQSVRLDVWSTGPKCPATGPTPVPVITPSPTPHGITVNFSCTTPGCTCVVLP